MTQSQSLMSSNPVLLFFLPPEVSDNKPKVDGVGGGLGGRNASLNIFAREGTIMLFSYNFYHTQSQSSVILFLFFFYHLKSVITNLGRMGEINSQII